MIWNSQFKKNKFRTKVRWIFKKYLIVKKHLFFYVRIHFNFVVGLLNLWRRIIWCPLIIWLFRLTPSSLECHHFQPNELQKIHRQQNRKRFGQKKNVKFKKYTKNYFDRILTKVLFIPPQQSLGQIPNRKSKRNQKSRPNPVSDLRKS